MPCHAICSLDPHLFSIFEATPSMERVDHPALMTRWPHFVVIRIGSETPGKPAKQIQQFTLRETERETERERAREQACPPACLLQDGRHILFLFLSSFLLPSANVHHRTSIVLSDISNHNQPTSISLLSLPRILLPHNASSLLQHHPNLNASSTSSRSLPHSASHDSPPPQQPEASTKKETPRTTCHLAHSFL
jgi:hypothetical protein